MRPLKMRANSKVAVAEATMTENNPAAYPTEQKIIEHLINSYNSRFIKTKKFLYVHYNFSNVAKTNKTVFIMPMWSK